MGNYNYVDIVCDVPTVGDKAFTYKVPKHCILPYGAKVHVPFGKRNVDGYIVDQGVPEPEFEVKDVLAVYDLDFLPPRPLLDFGLVLRDYYLATISSFWGYMWPPQVRKIKIATEGPITSYDTFDQTEKPSRRERESVTKHEELFIQGSHSFRWKMYQDAIEKAISAGFSVLVLVPEIARASIVEEELQSMYDREVVAVVHSDMSNVARRQQWLDIKQGKKRIVVGTRSAVFNPVRDLGLIIVDEEESPYYKAEEYPRYNGRTVARMRGRYQDCPVLLGSFVPSVVANFNLKEGKIRGVTEGFPAKENIDCQIVSLLGQKKRMLITKELHLAIGETFRDGNRALLFLNKRGTASSLVCRDCGNPIFCPRCSVPMAYHAREGQVVCHTCGYREVAPTNCPTCDGFTWKPVGYGIDRARSEFQKRFPNVPVFQLDKDVKESTEEAIEGFRSSKPSCLICTQVIFSVKNLPDLGVLGVLSADNILNLPDYLASEEVFRLLNKLLSLVNSSENGSHIAQKKQFIVQTLNPDHHAIQGVLDPEHFYAVETENRKALRYPPFGYVMKVTVSGKSQEKVIAASESLAAAIKSYSGGISVLGPSPAPKAKVRGQYRWHIMIKSNDQILAREVLKESLSTIKDGQVRVYVDLEEPFSLS